MFWWINIFPSIFIVCWLFINNIRMLNHCQFVFWSLRYVMIRTLVWICCFFFIIYHCYCYCGRQHWHRDLLLIVADTQLIWSQIVWVLYVYCIHCKWNVFCHVSQVTIVSSPIEAIIGFFFLLFPMAHINWRESEKKTQHKTNKQIKNMVNCLIVEKKPCFWAQLIGLKSRS